MKGIKERSLVNKARSEAKRRWRRLSPTSHSTFFASTAAPQPWFATTPSSLPSSRTRGWCRGLPAQMC
jgi:hypothetical protein